MHPIIQEWKNLKLVEKIGILAILGGAPYGAVALWHAVFPSPTPISYSEKIAKDDNPTVLAINKIEIKKWVDSSEAYLTLNINNSSKRTASNVEVQLGGNSGSWKFTQTSLSSIFQKNLAIKGNSGTEIPIGHVSDFLNNFRTSCAGCYLAGIGVNANIPTELESKICHDKLAKTGRCSLSLHSIQFKANIKFQTVFDDKISLDTVISAYFVDEIETEWQVPNSKK